MVAIATTVGTCAMMLGLATVARADYAPSSYDYTTGKGDVVCVGSDTVQIIGNFEADGDNKAHAGFNTAGNKYKLISLDATADANVRIAYALTSTVSSPQHLDPTVYFRAGQFPGQRANGSGSGYSALVADVTTTGSPEKINCVRGSSAPSAANFTSAFNNGWGDSTANSGLHVFEAASDNLSVVSVNTTPGTVITNVPAALSIAQLKAIYGSPGVTTWGALPGGYSPPNPSAAVGTTGNCPSCTILPLLPQSGSGTRKTFLTDIGVADPSGIASDVNQASEENDPSALTGSSDPADALAPFSGDRLNLFNSSYFHNPHTATTNNPWPGGSVVNAGVAIQPPTATASDGSLAYQDLRPLFFSYREIDDNAPGWQPGSATNWAHALFNGSSSFLGSSIKSKNLVITAGGTYAYKDCGTTSAAVTAACPTVVQG